ncbi:hypothetical protein HI914_01079 [Erysiphe necator]|nr:hypothetical protein HI914_01079 [Erysiphe necator]
MPGISSKLTFKSTLLQPEEIVVKAHRYRDGIVVKRRGKKRRRSWGARTQAKMG